MEILQVLWMEGPQTVRQVHEILAPRSGVGYTTVLKLLQNMADKQLVSREESSRSHVYAAAVGEEAIKRGLIAELVDRVFDGSAASLVMQALEAKRASPQELREIRALLDQVGQETQ
jgi:BlaI family transcriptional regulator, penicillinase repressor